MENCIVINGVQAIQLPKEGEKVYFNNHKKQLPVPFVIYADFESITEKEVVVLEILKAKKVTQKLTKNILLAVLVIKLFAIMIKSIQKIS